MTDADEGMVPVTDMVDDEEDGEEDELPFTDDDDEFPEDDPSERMETEP